MDPVGRASVPAIGPSFEICLWERLSSRDLTDLDNSTDSNRNQRLLLQDASEMIVGRVTAPAIRVLYSIYYHWPVR